MRKMTRAERVARHFHRALVEGNSGVHFDEMEEANKNWWIEEAKDALAKPLKDKKP